MIVAFEGLSCAGKSAVTSALMQNNNDLKMIPEFIVDLNEGITTELCKINDIAKSNYAMLLNSHYGTILLDRSFQSTLVYTYAEGKIKHKSTQEWYSQARQKGLIYEPDIYIYLRIQPDKSIQRAKLVNRYNDAYAWYYNTKAAYNHYETIFNSELIDKPCFIIDVDNLSFDQLLERTTTILSGLRDK